MAEIHPCRIEIITHAPNDHVGHGRSVRGCSRWTTAAGWILHQPSSIGTPSDVGWHVCKRGPTRFAALQPKSCMGLEERAVKPRPPTGAARGHGLEIPGSRSRPVSVVTTSPHLDVGSSGVTIPAVTTPSLEQPTDQRLRRREVQSQRSRNRSSMAVILVADIAELRISPSAGSSNSTMPKWIVDEATATF